MCEGWRSRNDRNKSMPGAYISNTIITNILNLNHTYIWDTLDPPLLAYYW